VSKVFTTCLVSGQPIDTGIEIDEASFERLPTFIGKVFCSHCGTEHGWTKEQAWLADSGKPKS
jgi:hypothetical protein